MTVLVLVIYVLAVMRVTRLINYDTIMSWVHVWAGNKWGPGSWQVEFFECPWCIGMWVALLTAWVPILTTDLTWWLYVPLALATSMVIGLAKPLFEDRDLELEPLP